MLKGFTQRSLPGVFRDAKGALAWDPGGIVKAQEMLVELQGVSPLSHRVVSKVRCCNA